MARWSLLIALMWSVTVIQESSAYNILFIGAIGSKSHQNFYKPIVEELAKSGHQVTFVTPYPFKGVKDNIREVVVPEGNVGLMNVNHFEQSLLPGVGHLPQMLSICGQTLANKEVQELPREKYDIVLLSNFFCDCYLSIIHQLKVPFIYVSPTRLLSTNAEDIGNPIFPAFLSFPILDYQHPFTFLQRTANVLMESIGVKIFRLMFRNIEERCRSAGLCPDDMPSFEEIQKNVSMIFLNSVRELEFPSRPYVPGIVHAGGIHCHPAKPLPQDLQEWIEGSGEHGFIFFSLGSVVKSTDLPEKNRKMLIKVFSSLKQRVLWKWDSDVMPGLPPNVKIMKWLPQQDILGHSKLRLFITHGGLFSTFESIYHGTPIIGLPVFADQQANMRTGESQGWGRTILWKDMTEEVLLQSINGVMDNQQMQQHVQMQSKIMRDQPISPQETVVYWTEYVIRYNGARHLRCPIADMPWYKIYNMDIWSMMLLLALLSLWIGLQMARWSLLIALMWSVTVIQESSAYNILFIGAIGSKSHQNFYKPIVEELAKSGHQVTFVTPYPSKGVKDNIREVVVPEGNLGLMNVNHFEQSLLPGVGHIPQFLDICDKTLANKEVQELPREKYDIVLLSNFFCDCYLSIVHQLKVPFIYVSPTRLLSTNAEDIGNPLYPAFLSIPILDYQHPFTFLQRTANVLIETIGVKIFRLMFRNMEGTCRSSGLCPDDMPSFEEIQKNVSMIFLNSVRELEFPSRPYVPGIVHAGGIHCHPAKPLPQDLQEWIEGSGEHGFIYFSLGSVVKSTDLPEKNRQMLIKVFSSLKQRVLWKWDGDVMPGLPPNVKIMKWLPQQDILGHSKLRLFITHGGLFSTFESIYHGTPIIGLPVFADQQSNMRTVESQGWGKTILWKDMTEEVLLQSIIGVIDNQQMQQHVQMQSKIMRDQPISPQETVVYWTEYVIRYNGARHLRCPIADMPWYKIYNMDIWSMMLLLALLSLWIGLQLLRAIVKCCRGTPKNKRD
ncbi:uncharacterized protein LOC135203627 [Macrobrachium nipponense]|uniref:uncharacterized protein LOC135203627 n=1 Tax=Macrobrachium nipponense TaxID=159736 RepID=UPI0030C8438E